MPSYEGYANLEPLNTKDAQRAREIRSAGGKASGKARELRRTMREFMQMLLEMPVAADNDKMELQLLGVAPDEQTHLAVLCVSLYMKAAAGNIPALRLIYELLDENNLTTLKADKLKIEIDRIKDDLWLDDEL